MTEKKKRTLREIEDRYIHCYSHGHIWAWAEESKKDIENGNEVFVYRVCSYCGLIQEFYPSQIEQ